MTQLLKKSIFLFLGLVLMSIQSYGQVKGISYTFSPVGEYVWWNDKAGFEDDFLVGGQLGFGFGEYVELRANYMQSLDLQTDISQFGLNDLPEIADTLFGARNTELNRWGGEMMFNLSRGWALPYLTVGTGIQTIAPEQLREHKQIYLTAGLGIKLSAGDRFTLGLQGINTSYRYASVGSLLSEEELEALESGDPNLETEILQNWSARASLTFYLGGRKPGELSEIDKAYLDNFSSGFSGLSIPLEPMVAKVNFHENLPFKDAWFAGGATGFNFGPYVGIRGFYWRAMEEGNFGTFDKLAMYGGEGKFKLSFGSGLTPYLTVGGGQIDVIRGYEEANGIGRDLDDTPFVTGGLGLDLPFSKYFKLTGFAKSILTSSSDPENIAAPDQLNASWMYGASMNLVFGKKAKRPEITMDKPESYESAADKLDAQSASDDPIANEYNEKIDEIQQQLNDKEISSAKDLEDIEKMLAEKKMYEDFVKKINEAQLSQQNQVYYQGQGGSVIKMSPAEFQNLIREILNGGGNAPTVIQQPQSTGATSTEILELKQEMNEKNTNGQLDQIFDKLEEIIDNQEEMEERIDNLENGKSVKNSKKGKTSSIKSKKDKDVEVNVNIEKEDIQYSKTNTRSKSQMEYENEYASEEGFFSKFNYNGASAFVGFNVGGNATANVGYRTHYKIGETRFTAMPEAYFGFGNPAAFGAFANVTYDFKIMKSDAVHPYVGAGLGFLKSSEDGEDKLNGAYNLMLGAEILSFGKGRIYADYTIRNLFKYNQLAIGYRLPF